MDVSATTGMGLQMGQGANLLEAAVDGELVLQILLGGAHLAQLAQVDDLDRHPPQRL